VKDDRYQEANLEKRWIIFNYCPESKRKLMTNQNLASNISRAFWRRSALNGELSHLIAKGRMIVPA